jgi:hypothetical protein
LSAAALAAVALLSLSSCSTAQVKDVWTAPDVTKLSFKKVLVIAATKDGATRRSFEDAAVTAMPEVVAVASYAFLKGEADITDATKISAELKGAGFDGVVVMRMIGDRSEVNVYQDMSYPTGYRTFGGYYGRYAMMGYNSTTVTTDRIISVETNIYEFPGERLIWSGVTESTSPGNITQLVNDAIGAIRQQLIKQKLIAAPAK